MSKKTIRLHGLSFLKLALTVAFTILISGPVAAPIGWPNSLLMSWRAQASQLEPAPNAESAPIPSATTLPNPSANPSVNLGAKPAAAVSTGPSPSTVHQMTPRPDAERILKARTLAEAGKFDDARKLLGDGIATEKDHERRALLRMALGLINFKALTVTPEVTPLSTTALPSGVAPAILPTSVETIASEAAKEQFTKAIDDGTRLSDYAHFYLGLLDERAKDGKAARAEFGDVIRSRTPKATEADARFELANLYLSDKQWKPAIAELEMLRRSLKSDERYADILFDLLKAEKKSGGRGGMCKVARELFSKYPTYAAISTGEQVWGPALNKDTIDGEKLGCTADAKDLKMRVRRLWLGGDDERAEKELHLIHKDHVADPDDADDAEAAAAGPSAVDKLFVNHLIGDGRIDEALKILFAHYEAEKNRPGYLQLLGKTAAVAGENQMAVSAYQRAFELAPGSKDGINALFQAAFTSYQMQDYDGASRRFEQFLKVRPSSGLARDSQWYLAWIRYLRGDYQGALDSFQTLSKSPAIRRVARRRRRRGQLPAMASSDAVAKDRLQYWSAVSLLKMGKVPEALPLLQTLVRDPSLGYYSMLAYYRLLAIPKAKIPLDVEVRLGLTHGSGSAIPTEEELTAAAQNAAETASADYEDDTAHSADADVPEEVADPGTEAESVADKETSPDNPDTVPGAMASDGFKEAGLSSRFERARDLALIGLENGARRELAEIEKHVRSNVDRKRLMSEYANVKNFERSSFLGEMGFGAERLRTGFKGESRQLWEYAYPRAWESSVVQSSKSTAVPEELIWGIMRAESHYRFDAQSPVGALGLMQMMPFTGRKVADLMNLKSFQTRTLLEPETNIKLGSRYLQRLFEKFSGKVPLVAASYNAGPHRVYSWVRNFGTLDMDEFVEHIPYVETRNYVKRVVRNFHIYSLLYRGSGVTHGNTSSSNSQAMRWMIQPVGLQLAEPPMQQEIW